MPLPPTLSVPCPTQPSGPPTPPRLSHCTLAQSTSSPHLLCTLGGSRVISTLNSRTHIPRKPHSPTHRHTALHMSNPATSALLYLSCPRPWSETLIWIHGNSCSLAFSTGTSASFSKFLSCWLTWSHRLQPLLDPRELFLALDPSLSRSYHSCFLKVWIQRQFLWEPALFNPIGQWGINCKCYKRKETRLHILSRKHHVFHFLFSFQKSHLLILWSWRNCKVFTW